MSKDIRNLRFVVQVFESGTINVRGKEKPLRLVFRFDPITGKIVSVERNTHLPSGVTPYKISRREYYQWGKKYIPRQPMTEEERKKAHVEAVKRHRKKKKG